MFKNYTKNDLKAIAALAIIYALENFLMLLNRGIYWDGWFFIPAVLQKSPILDYRAIEQKLYAFYYTFKLLEFTENPILAAKILSFSVWLLAGICLYGILRKKLGLRLDRAFFISAFFIATPVYLVRAEVSILPYSASSALFFLAAFIYFTAEGISNKILAAAGKAASWIIFSLSFFTHSLLVFYGGFLLLHFLTYRQKNKEQPLMRVSWLFLKDNFFFIILPIIFWSLKLTIWEPTGIHTGYNEFIPLKTVVSSFGATIIVPAWNTITFGFFWPIVAPITILSRKIFALLFLIIGAIVYFLVKKISGQKEGGTDFSPKYYLAAGGILFFLGFLPYFLVGKSPHIYGDGFDMRHALLLPLGSSLAMLGAILLVVKENWQSKIQTALLTLFIVFTVYNYYRLDMDHYKQLAVIESLRTSKNENIVNASTLIFHDQVPLNWSNRSVHGEEYIGYVQEIYKDYSKFAVAEWDDIAANYNGYMKVAPNLYAPDFNPKKKIEDVYIVSRADYELPTVWNWLELKKYELFSDNQTLLNEIRGKLQIEVITTD